jgi:hypothetical protein
MRVKRIHIKLAVVLAVVFTALVMKSLLQKTWIYMSGAVIPSRSATLRSTEHHNLLLSVGGERWLSRSRLEEASAYHALVIPPGVELREDGSISTSDGVSHTETLKWLCPSGPADVDQAYEAKSLTLTYEAITQRVTIGADSYWLAKGNLFVIRLDDRWRPHVTQLATIFSKAVEEHEVREIFKRALPNDETVKKL